MSEDEFNAAISKLAAMSFGAYERVRAGEAKRLRIRVFALDTLVARKRPANEAVPGQGRPLDFPPPEPWLDPVNGAMLLDKIEAIIRRFIICSKHAATAMTLWIVATWFEEVAQVAPILNFKSPLHRCGKSTCLAIVGRLVKRRLLSSNTTPAALFRAIEKFQPTLVIDEADSFFGQNEELRGIINSGHTRETAFTLRTVGDELEPKTFSTWGFKAIAGIGRLAVTIEDRSITIELKRKTRAEKVDRLRHTNPQEFEYLSRQLARSCRTDV
jgi:putative DNA primase/helicase